MMQDERDRLLALFEDESRWCQRVEARDKQGHPVRYSDERAAAWDVVGGMCFLFGWDRACKLFVQVSREVTGLKRGRVVRDPAMSAMGSLQDFNDKRDTTFDLIMERLRKMRVYSRRLAPLGGSQAHQAISTSAVCSG
jgi:hypothetical protein